MARRGMRFWNCLSCWRVTYGYKARHCDYCVKEIRAAEKLNLRDLQRKMGTRRDV